MSVPMVFGVKNRELYGVYHPAIAVGHAGRGVVFCNPFINEATTVHRAVRLLADSLAKDRVHCLRFDYYATGDSAGDSQEIDVASHGRDIGDAIDELKAISGVELVYLVGIRLGALLALDTAKARSDVAGVIAWEPIVDGRKYCDELRDAIRPLEQGLVDLGGLVLEGSNLERLEEMNLSESLLSVECNVGLVASSNNPEVSDLQILLQVSEFRGQKQLVEDQLPWKADSVVGVPPLPAHATRVIKLWLTSP